MTHTDDTPMGLAAAARVLADPNVTVSKMLAAIKEGRLAHSKDDRGRFLVTLSAVRTMLAGDELPAEAPAAEEAPTEVIDVAETDAPWRSKKKRKH